MAEQVSKGLLHLADGKEIDEVPWKLMIIDDDEALHAVTRLTFDGYCFEQRNLKLVSAYSAEEAKLLMQKHPDTHVILLDVVMETDDAGLQFIKYVRQELNNKFVRIILRTGQPGQAPEKQVIIEYDINDYREKTDLTAQKLITTVTSALRTYKDLKTIESLIISNEQLEQHVQKRTSELHEINQRLKQEIAERIETEKALKRSQENLLAIISNSVALVYLKNIKGQYLLVNHQYEVIFNIKNREIQGKTDYDILPKKIAEQLWANDKEVLKASEPLQFEEAIPHQDKTHTYISVKFPLFNNEKEAYRICGISTDITEYKRNEEERYKLSRALEQAADAVAISDKNGIIEYVNQGFEKVTGFSKAEVVGRKISLLKSGKQNKNFYQKLWNTILSGEIFSDIFINKRKDGAIFYEEKTITPLKDNKGNITHFIATGKDISERMEFHKHIYHLAHHDSLTDLPNRVLLEDRLQQALTRMGWHNRSVAVLFLDMDRFKIINDTLGHRVGDQLLRMMAKRLLKCVREGDTVARLGGDEFAIILNDIASKNDIIPITQSILETLARPFLHEGQELFISTSIGISLFPSDGKDSQSLLTKADVAMYKAKANGGNNYRFYTKDDDNKAVEHLALETNLRRALEREEFVVYYQPQLNLRTGKIAGVEALLRWQHPSLNMITPKSFIPIMEETGLIVPVGEWVLRNVCKQGKIWQDSGLPTQDGNFLPSIRISINISICQFQQPDFVKMIEKILQETGFKSQNLVLEITESVMAKDVTKSTNKLQELHKLGVLLAIDDFGTGYSSMNYLKQLPFDILKIDKTFVGEVAGNPNDAAICASIITLGHALKLKVVAEGVETMQQLEFLKLHNCDEIQGYICSHPVNIDMIAKYFT